MSRGLAALGGKRTRAPAICRTPGRVDAGAKSNAGGNSASGSAKASEQSEADDRECCHTGHDE